MKFFGLLAKSILLLSAARAESDAFPPRALEHCSKPPGLAAITRVCADNHHYRRAAEECAALLLETIAEQQQITTTALQKQNKANLGEGKNRQIQDFVATDADYQTTLKHLAYLLKEAGETHSLLDTYRDGVVFPSNWATHSESEGEHIENIWSQACFSSAAGKIDALLDQVEARTRDLSSTKAEMENLTGIAQGRGTLLKHNAAKGGQNTAAKKTLGKGSGKFKDSPAPKSSSTITGDIKPESLGTGKAP